jgi:hypothetical protein
MRFPGMLRQGKPWPILSSSASSSPVATHVDDYSTAHDSGVRAAEEVIAALTSPAARNPTKSGSKGSS